MGPADGEQYKYSNTVSGLLEEHGHTSQSADSTFSWTNGDWNETKHDSSDSASHLHYGTANMTGMTTSNGLVRICSISFTGAMRRYVNFD